MTAEMSVSDLVSSLQVKALVNACRHPYSKHFNGSLMNANGGMVVIRKGAASPRIITVADNHALTNIFDEGDLDSSNSRDEVTFEPESKKQKVDPAEDLQEVSLKEILKNVHKAIVLRLDSMEKKMDSVTLKCQHLDARVESMADQLRRGGVKMHEALSDSLGKFNMGPGSSSNITLITLNSESEYPDGSWLGDENNPEFRVRCHLTPNDLTHINRNCQTPEKMALTLLDYLFDRETQACSNISGHGKHGKKQLDPLMIYGVKCHLTHKFGISEKDWQRIKLNLDSKCRTAFRRKLKGMPLKVKAFRERGGLNELSANGEMDESSSANDGHSDELLTMQLHAVAEEHRVAPMFSLNNVNLLRRTSQSLQVADRTLVIKGCSSRGSGSGSGSLDMSHMMDMQDEKEALVDLMESHTVQMELGLDVESIDLGINQESPIIHTSQGAFQVVRATKEQLEEFHRSGKIKILSGNHFFQEVTDVVNLSAHDHAATDINLQATVVPNGLILDDDGHDAITQLKIPGLIADDEKDGL